MVPRAPAKVRTTFPVVTQGCGSQQVETQREASARCLTQHEVLPEATMDIFLSPVSTRVMFKGLRKRKPRHLCLEPPSASNSEPRFLGDPFIKPLRFIHLPVHPPTAFPNRSGEYRKRETQNHRSEERILPSCQPQAPWCDPNSAH
ncbi:hypothetical protein ATANTOWER_022490 [Ataeniobius toweri]|uniref:Uncharacterized protein n=1 Tax=Ataeniobius toweri TaxID=208326 RepID=A0ABU7BHI4_9TELE|nr:hypothetical protein [Ataeniobius toweri]